MHRKVKGHQPDSTQIKYPNIYHNQILKGQRQRDVPESSKKNNNNK